MGNLETMPNDLQLLIALAIFVAAGAGPLHWVRRLYERPSFLYQRPWRATAALFACAVLVLPVGFVVTLLISFAASLLGYDLFNGDHGFKALYALLFAVLQLFLAGIIVGILTTAGRLPAGTLGHRDGDEPPSQ